MGHHLVFQWLHYDGLRFSKLIRFGVCPLQGQCCYIRRLSCIHFGYLCASGSPARLDPVGQRHDSFAAAHRRRACSTSRADQGSLSKLQGIHFRQVFLRLFFSLSLGFEIGILFHLQRLGWACRVGKLGHPCVQPSRCARLFRLDLVLVIASDGFILLASPVHLFLTQGTIFEARLGCAQLGCSAACILVQSFFYAARQGALKGPAT